MRLRWTEFISDGQNGDALSSLVNFNLSLRTVPVQRDADQGGHRHRGLRGGTGHGPIGLLPEQQHHLSVERAQSGPGGHTGTQTSNKLIAVFYTSAS